LSEPKLGRFDDLDMLDVSEEVDGEDPLDPAASDRELVLDDEPDQRRPGRLAGAVARLAAPLAARLAPIGRSIERLTAPLASRVPAAALAAGLGFAGVLCLFLIGGSLLGGMRSAEASLAAAGSPIAASAADRSEAAPTPTRPAPTPTPRARTFEPLKQGWLATGRVMPDPRHRLPADQMLFLGQQGGSYTISTRLTVLMRSGPLAPLWGIALGYQDELNHLRLEFFTDSYDRNRPYVGLFLTKNGTSRLVGPTTRLSGLDFWGRDEHEVVVDVRPPQIAATIDGQTVGSWRYQDTLPPDRQALYLWGASRIRFDSFELR
jgi:hypothetical protein